MSDEITFNTKEEKEIFDDLVKGTCGEAKRRKPSTKIKLMKRMFGRDLYKIRMHYENKGIDDFYIRGTDGEFFTIGTMDNKRKYLIVAKFSKFHHGDRCYELEFHENCCLPINYAVTLDKVLDEKTKEELKILGVQNSVDPAVLYHNNKGSYIKNMLIGGDIGKQFDKIFMVVCIILIVVAIEAFFIYTLVSQSGASA